MSEAGAEHGPDPLRTARLLLRGSRAAVLGTVAAGQPHTALVTPAWLAGLDAVLLLSSLSRHTGQLRDNPRCALHVAAAAPPVPCNPQTIPRLSLSGVAMPDPDPRLRLRYLAVHPYADLYAGFGDFAIWRVTMTQVHAVAGFGKAWSGGIDRLAVPVGAVAAYGADAAFRADFDQAHAAVLARIGERLTGVRAAWRLVGTDPDGCDLGCASGSVHVGFPGSAAPGDVAAGLAALVAEDCPR